MTLHDGMHDNPNQTLYLPTAMYRCLHNRATANSALPNKPDFSLRLALSI